MYEKVIDFYSSYNEKDRLIERHNLERIRSQEIISRYLPLNTTMHILDIGGASGIYSFWLASLGHSVDLIDLTPKHVKQAIDYQNSQDVKLSSIQIGNSCSLPYKDCIYDLVLLMGPLYHLLDYSDRLKSLSEAKRVLKNGGTIIIAAISRYASLFDGYLRDVIVDDEFYQIVKNDIYTGIHKNKTNNLNYFTDAYFHHHYNLRTEIEEAGIHCEKIISVEGFGLFVPDVEKKLLNERYKQKLLFNLKELEEDLTIIGMSPHYLAIGRK